MSLTIQPPPTRTPALQRDGIFNREWLSWFNDLFEIDKISQANLTFNAPLVKTGTTVSIPKATATVDGYLYATDWATFNAKEPAITAGTTAQYWRGDKTWQTLSTAVFGTLTGMLKATAGVVSVATLGTDYDNYWMRTSTTMSPRTVTDSLGIGVATAAANIHSLKTTEQLRLGYSATVYNSLTVDSAGMLTIAPTTGTTLSGVVKISTVRTSGAVCSGELLLYATNDDAYMEIVSSDVDNWETGIKFSESIGSPRWKIFTGAGNAETAHNLRITSNTTALILELSRDGILYLKNQINSSLATGTAPLDVDSETLCTNLNAEHWNSKHLGTCTDTCLMRYNATGTQIESSAITEAAGALGGITTIAMTGTITGATGYNGLVITANTGAITTGSWHGTTIAVDHGGTGLASYAVGDIVHATGATTLAGLADVAVGQVLCSGGVGVVPAYSATPTVSGILMPASSYIRPSVADSVTAIAVQDLAGNLISQWDSTNHKELWYTTTGVNYMYTTGSATLPGMVFENLLTANKAITFMGLQVAAVSDAYGVFYPVTAATNPALFVIAKQGSGVVGTAAVYLNANDYITYPTQQTSFRMAIRSTECYFWHYYTGTGMAALPINFYASAATLTQLAISIQTSGAVGIGPGAASATHTCDVYNNQNGTTALWVDNRNAGASTIAQAICFNGASNYLSLYQYGSGANMTDGGLTLAGAALIRTIAANGFLINQYSNGPMFFGTNNIVRGMITGAGNCGFGAFSATVTPVSLFELYSASASPVLTITGLHASSYDPTIHFRTDSPATVKFAMGVDSTDDSFWLNHGTSLGANYDFTINASGNIGMGILSDTEIRVRMYTDATNANRYAFWTDCLEIATVNGSYNLIGNVALATMYATTGVSNGGYAKGQQIYSVMGCVYAGYNGTEALLVGSDIFYGMNGAVSNPTVTEAYGIRLSRLGPVGTFGTVYDLYISAPTTGATIGTNWCIYSANTAASRLLGTLQTAGYLSSDGSAGDTFTHNIADLTSITVKNGLIVAHT